MPNPFEYINMSYLESISDGNTEIISELVTIFIEQVPEFTDGFKDGLETNNWKLIAAVAHKAKSSVISMGMDDLGNETLKNLELLAKSFLIYELENGGVDNEDISNLKRNISSYPEERIEWVKNHMSKDFIEDLIDTFNNTCQKAIIELNEVIKN